MSRHRQVRGQGQGEYADQYQDGGVEAPWRGFAGRGLRGGSHTDSGGGGLGWSARVCHRFAFSC
ncbi:hypothetical protein RR42_m0780 [Cupriavidus basilensis]|uniref:Uncharacterized protein n=1 Tax=Cupriavidus basilensis TaxID=68895 RepID=A0A0C4Y043_9BURK|nr:hypothetical protein RR42_m0780 [Cupriavidus basilensis]